MLTLEKIELALREHGSLRAAARALDVPYTTLHDKIRREKERADSISTDLKDEETAYGDLSIRERLEFDRRRFLARMRKKADEKWFEVKVKQSKPYGILWFGDPHIDDNYCNIDLLLRHIDYAKADGVYGANIGDTTNNWSGRLMRLWANQDTSQKTARERAEWLMFESGVDWLVWLLGNHDVWGDDGDFYKRLGATRVPVVDWRAQFILTHKSGNDVRVDAAHGRKGRSDWNELHGLVRAAKREEEADLYLSGHTHNFGLEQLEIAERGFVTWLAQVRGYKWADTHAWQNGFFSGSHGAAVLSIIDPTAEDRSRRVTCFSDVDRGMDYLGFIRNIREV